MSPTRLNGMSPGAAFRRKRGPVVTEGKMAKRRLGLIGCGAIGRLLALYVRDRLSDGCTLAAVSSRTREHAVRLGTELGVPALSPEEVIAECDLIVEATSAMAMPSLVRAAMAAGKEIICLSVGGFVLDDRLLGEVMAGKSPVHVPSGAIAGLDGVRALREAGLDSLSLTTVKRPESLGLEDISALPGVQNAEGISLSAEARLLFDGSAEEAIRRFPANVNVAVALALAGPGPEKTRMRLIADPLAEGTRHYISARAGACALDITTSPAALPENPRSSALAMYSVPALIRQLTRQLKIAS